jgi:hypothetical protein
MLAELSQIDITARRIEMNGPGHKGPATFFAHFTIPRALELEASKSWSNNHSHVLH